MSNILTNTYKLADGNEIPLVGLGTYLLDDPNKMDTAVTAAYEAGYRLFDTAQLYQNEALLGEAIRKLGINRNQIFITDKITEMNQGYDLTINSAEYSLQQLGTDYFDLLLVHWPISDKFFDTWRAFEELKKQGKAKSIGVSNFTQTHLQLLKTQATEMPVLNQIETHPYLTQRPMVEFDKQESILTQAWSPLGRGLVLDNPMIAKMADHHNRSVAQIVLRWQLQRGVAVIPKSQTTSRIQANIDLDFKLSDDEMTMIDILNKNQRTGNEPELVYETGNQY
ncbi:aldo/keto reductase [Lentilactobacillus kosonis]|uniref:Oxidoreductase of aldo/keto reductase family, subgroup 1 n=1 Tax=Lentilactobacillus kosonis TaxID=2810561 RepID=A0A401FMT7_9LACO|nr:aldo/keto reductase [Lentilactobacillus kosonis]GAY73705.1 oxidoreductase of aldo/keto reductase family, subgroup 1 [Lentilactobacillus kosonis]